MYKLSKLIITVIAIISIICCVPVVSAIDTTEPTGTASEPATKAPAEQQEDNNYPIFALLFAIGVPTGCLLAQGLSFWKW